MRMDRPCTTRHDRLHGRIPQAGPCSTLRRSLFRRSVLVASCTYLLLQPLEILVEVHHEAVVLGLAYLLDVIMNLDLEREPASVYRDQLRFRAHLLADGRRSHVSYRDRYPHLA